MNFNKKKIKCPALYKYMRDNNVSLEALSSKTGVSQTVIRDIGKGKANPCKTTIDKLTSFTGLSFEQIFNVIN